MGHEINFTEIQKSLEIMRTSTPAIRDNYLDEVAYDIYNANLPHQNFDTLLQNLQIGELTKLKLRTKVERIKKTGTPTQPLIKALKTITSELEELRAWKASQKKAAENPKAVDAQVAAKEPEAKAKTERLAKEAADEEKTKRPAKEAAVTTATSLQQELTQKLDKAVKTIESLNKGQTKEAFNKKFQNLNDINKLIKDGSEPLDSLIKKAESTLKDESAESVVHLRERSACTNGYLESLIIGYHKNSIKYEAFIKAIEESCEADSDHYICKSENDIIGRLNDLYYHYLTQ